MKARAILEIAISVGAVGAQRFGDTGDDGEFTNGTHLPLFVNMTCLNGYFEAPNADSLAESLLNAKGGEL